MSMVSRSVRPNEWRMGDKREELGWIRRRVVDGRETFLCVTRDEVLVCGGDTLRDAAETFLAWSRRG